MRDAAMLRDRLWAILVLGPLALPTGCGPRAGGGTEPEVEVVSNAGDGAAVAETPWPADRGCSVNGTWCAPAMQIARTVGVAPARACEATFDHEGLRFTPEPGATDAARTAGHADACCFAFYDVGSQQCYIKGRPLLDRGAAQLAPTRPGNAWQGRRRPDVDVDGLAAPLRDALARRWLAAALAEHASVASFARATLELMALGAPPALVAGCQRAGLDEVRHAEACFALAARFGAAEASPGPLPAPAPRPATLARLAVDTFLEGCVGETVATLVETRTLEGCRDEAVARVLRRLVADETRHAALAWQTVAWAIAEGGEEVAAAVRAAADAAAGAAAARRGGGHVAPELLAHGCPDEATRLAAEADAWRVIIGPTVARLTAGAAAGRDGGADAA